MNNLPYTRNMGIGPGTSPGNEAARELIRAHLRAHNAVASTPPSSFDEADDNFPIVALGAQLTHAEIRRQIGLGVVNRLRSEVPVAANTDRRHLPDELMIPVLEYAMEQSNGLHATGYALNHHDILDKYIMDRRTLGIAREALYSTNRVVIFPRQPRTNRLKIVYPTAPNNDHVRELEIRLSNYWVTAPPPGTAIHPLLTQLFRFLGRLASGSLGFQRVQVLRFEFIVRSPYAAADMQTFLNAIQGRAPLHFAVGRIEIDIPGDTGGTLEAQARQYLT